MALLNYDTKSVLFVAAVSKILIKAVYQIQNINLNNRIGFERGKTLIFINRENTIYNIIRNGSCIPFFWYVDLQNLSPFLLIFLLNILLCVSAIQFLVLF